MAAPIFTWFEDWGGEQAHKPRNFIMQLGDGYVERAGNGINTDLPAYTITFSGRTTAEAQAIMAFLVTTCAAGVIAFQFQPYGDAVSSLWTCNDYKMKAKAVNVFDISCVFQKVVA